MRFAFLFALLFPFGAAAFEHQAWDALLKKHVVLLDGSTASQPDYDWPLNGSRSSSRR